MEEWAEHRHVGRPGEPTVLEATPEVESLIAAVAEAGALEIELLRSGFRVTSKAWVGRVRVGGLTLVIHPKIANAPMLELLRYAFGLRSVRLFGQAEHETAALGFEDLLLTELLAECSELVARGLNRRYVLRDEILESPRGRVDFQELSRCPQTNAALPCQHHLRLVDTPLNRALLAGLAVARVLASDSTLRARLHRLENLFEGVSPRRLIGPVLDVAMRDLDRTTVAYGPALHIIELLLRGMGVVLTNGRRVPLRGFLFDMNRFFQALLARFLRENLSDGAVFEERPLHETLRWDAGRNPHRWKDPLPRPDFAVRVEHGALELLDAKYQDLGARPPSRDVTYQLATYAMSKDGRGRSTVLFPGTRSVADQALLVCAPLDGRREAELVFRAVDLVTMHELLGRGGSRRARADYARELVFGRAERISRTAVGA